MTSLMIPKTVYWLNCNEVSMVGNDTRPPLRRIEIIPYDDPNSKIVGVGRFEGELYYILNGRKFTLKISADDIPDDGPLSHKLTPDQMQALWLIAECSFLKHNEEDEGGIPVWRIAELLEKRINNISRDVIKPLEKEWGLACCVKRKSTKKGTAHRNQLENAYYLKRTRMRTTLGILLPYFIARNLNNLNDSVLANQPQEVARYNRLVAAMRFIVLALLQERIKTYEGSVQHIKDVNGTLSDKYEVLPLVVV